MKVRNHPRIAIDPTVCHGKPVVAGTRVLVGNILGALASGQAIPSILEDYPSIKAKDVMACLEFASDLAQFETLPDSAVPA
jgi:uncharacterized protein (DUF433 family)